MIFTHRDLSDPPNHNRTATSRSKTNLKDIYSVCIKLSVVRMTSQIPVTNQVAIELVGRREEVGRIIKILKTSKI